MHIIWLILKIIGIIIGIVAGTLALLILMVLLIPVRYQIKAEKQQWEEHESEGINAVFRLSWLLQILSVKAAYQNNKFFYRVSLFGFTLRNSENRKRRTKKTSNNAKTNTILEQQKKETDTLLNNIEDNAHSETLELPQFSENQDIPTEQKNMDAKGDRNNSGTSKKKSIFQKIKHLFIKIKYLFQTRKNILKNVLANLGKIKENIDSIFQKIKKVLAFLKDEENKKGFGIIKITIKRLFQHIKPQEIKGEVHFGTGDPCSTGQVLAVSGILFSYYGEEIQVIPDFYNPILEGKIAIKGRIRLGTILIIAIKLYFNKEFQILWKKWNQFKEEL